MKEETQHARYAADQNHQFEHDDMYGGIEATGRPPVLRFHSHRSADRQHDRGQETDYPAHQHTRRHRAVTVALAARLLRRFDHLLAREGAIGAEVVHLGAVQRLDRSRAIFVVGES